MFSNAKEVDVIAENIHNKLTIKFDSTTSVYSRPGCIGEDAGFPQLKDGTTLFTEQLYSPTKTYLSTVKPIQSPNCDLSMTPKRLFTGKNKTSSNSSPLQLSPKVTDMRDYFIVTGNTPTSVGVVEIQSSTPTRPRQEIKKIPLNWNKLLCKAEGSSPSTSNMKSSMCRPLTYLSYGSLYPKHLRSVQDKKRKGDKKLPKAKRHCQTNKLTNYFDTSPESNVNEHAIDNVAINAEGEGIAETSTHASPSTPPVANLGLGDECETVIEPIILNSKHFDTHGESGSLLSVKDRDIRRTPLKDKKNIALLNATERVVKKSPTGNSPLSRSPSSPHNKNKSTALPKVGTNHLILKYMKDYYKNPASPYHTKVACYTHTNDNINRPNIKNTSSLQGMEVIIINSDDETEPEQYEKDKTPISKEGSVIDLTAALPTLCYNKGPEQDYASEILSPSSSSRPIQKGSVIDLTATPSSTRCDKVPEQDYAKEKLSPSSSSRSIQKGVIIDLTVVAPSTSYKTPEQGYTNEILSPSSMQKCSVIDLTATPSSICYNKVPQQDYAKEKLYPSSVQKDSVVDLTVASPAVCGDSNVWVQDSENELCCPSTKVKDSIIDLTVASPCVCVNDVLVHNSEKVVCHPPKRPIGDVIDLTRSSPSVSNNNMPVKGLNEETLTFIPSVDHKSSVIDLSIASHSVCYNEALVAETNTISPRRNKVSVKDVTASVSSIESIEHNGVQPHHGEKLSHILQQENPVIHNLISSNEKEADVEEASVSPVLEDMLIQRGVPLIMCSKLDDHKSMQGLDRVTCSPLVSLSGIPSAVLKDINIRSMAVKSLDKTIHLHIPTTTQSGNTIANGSLIRSLTVGQNVPQIQDSQVKLVSPHPGNDQQLQATVSHDKPTMTVNDDSSSNHTRKNLSSRSSKLVSHPGNDQQLQSTVSHDNPTMTVNDDSSSDHARKNLSSRSSKLVSHLGHDQQLQSTVSHDNPTMTVNDDSSSDHARKNLSTRSSGVSSGSSSVCMSANQLLSYINEVTEKRQEDPAKRLELVAPLCLRRSSPCFHTKFCQVSTFFINRLRLNATFELYPLHLSSCTNLCSRDRFLDVVTLQWIVQFILNHGDTQLAVEAVTTFHTLVDGWPPCTPRAHLYYMKFLSDPYEYTNFNMGLFEMLLLKVEGMFAAKQNEEFLYEDDEDYPGNSDSGNEDAPSLAKHDDIETCFQLCSTVATEEMKARKAYDSFPIEEQRERLVAVLDTVVHIMEQDLIVYLMNKDHAQLRGLTSPAKQPLVVNMVWRGQSIRVIGTMTTTCRRIVKLYLSSSGMLRRPLARLVSLMAEVAANSELTKDPYSYIGPKSYDYARGIFQMIPDDEDVTNNIMVELKPSWLGLSIIHLRLCKLMESDRPISLELVIACLNLLVNPLPSSNDCSTNVKPTKINRRNPKGETRLHVVCRNKKRIDEVRSLLSDPAIDVNIKDNAGWTPLHEAVFVGNIQCVELLLNYRPGPGGRIVDVKAKGPGELSVLMEAVNQGWYDICDMLLKHAGWCLLEDKDENGLKCKDFAKSPQMLEVLQAAKTRYPHKTALSQPSLATRTLTQTKLCEVTRVVPEYVRLYLNTYQMQEIMNMAKANAPFRNDVKGNCKHQEYFYGLKNIRTVKKLAKLGKRNPHLDPVVRRAFEIAHPVIAS